MSIDLANKESSKKGLEIIAKLKAAIEYEAKHMYINAQGKSASFSDFIKKEASQALKIFKHSAKWSTIKALVERYAFIDITSRINTLKQVREALEQLESLYDAKLSEGTHITKFKNDFASSPEQEEIVITKKKEAEIKIDPNLDISSLDVQFVHGVGPRLAEKLNKVGIYSCEDLLNYLPRDHISYETKILIKDLEEDDDVTIFGQIDKITAFQTKKGMVIITILVKDPSGKIKINRFVQGNSIHFYLKQYKSQFPVGSPVLVSGKVKPDKYSKMKQIQNAMMEIVAEDFVEGEDNIHTGRIVPIYPLTEGLSLMQLRKLIYKSLKYYKANLKEFIPDEVLSRHELMNYYDALQEIHFPTDLALKDSAAKRLIFNEFFLMQLRFMQIKDQIKNQNEGIKFNCFENGLVDKFIASLPFKLTGAQERVFYSEILPDMVSTAPMHRLIQGDVGSGKTIVAFLAILVAVSDGYQGALMVPTEILAEQHYKKIQEWVSKMAAEFQVKVALLLGKQRVRERRAVLQGLADGSINVVVGTHALIQDSVEFNKLGLVVIDEQHRFGVKQREMLARKALSNTADQSLNEKDEAVPIVEKLFMSATPIPRTLALATHGDLDMSEIDELPPGRSPIITEIVKRKPDTYKKIRSEIAAGRQAYIVFPLIDESEALSAKAATVEFERLKTEVYPDFKIGLIHGKLKDDEKESVMEEFRSGALDILVATTVIEVGVDVPNATTMLIESAERFGLAQLHQLRGRVGRGDKQSYCFLSSSSKSPNNLIRLKILTSTTNGFIVAQEDMKLRGAGDFLGVKQSGLPESAIASLAENEDVLVLARNSAKNLIQEDHELTKHKVLKEKLENSAYSNMFSGG